MNVTDYQTKLRTILGDETVDRVKALSATMLDWPDMWCLFVMARTVPDGGAICEIGSAWGGSLSLFAAAAAPSASIVCIDPYEPWDLDGKASVTGSAEALRKAAIAANCVERFAHVAVPSDDAAASMGDRTFDLVFVDGAHAYRQVASDLANYWPLVRRGGWLVGHDHAKPHPGVIQAVAEWDMSPWVTLGVNSSCYFVQKVDQ